MDNPYFKDLEVLDSVTNKNEQNEVVFEYPTWVKGMVIFLSLIVVVLVGFQMNDRMSLVIPALTDSIQYLSGTANTLLDQDDETLKQQDSDFDGLSDYDELNIHGSSPYLADSDSDGISDKSEVEANTDPNCPKDTNCFNLQNTQTSQNPIDPNQSFAQVFTEQPEIAQILGSPEQIRELLIKNGADPEIVNSLDNQSLQLLAQQTLQTITGPTQEKADILTNLTPDQIRNFLITEGADPTEVNELSDEELLDIYNEVLKESKDLLTPQN